MVGLTFIFSYVIYLILRKVLMSLNIIELDFYPNYYYDDPKRTWINAGVLIGCFVVTVTTIILLFGTEVFSR